MNRILHLLTSVTLLSGSSLVMADEQSWAFVTSVGGLELGAPVQVDNRWEMPVRADVSGTKSITVKPTMLNSGLVCERTKAHVEGRDIFIVIVTTVPHGDASSRCPAANLGTLQPGQYDVLYGANRAEGIRLGTIKIGTDKQPHP